MPLVGGTSKLPTPNPVAHPSLTSKENEAVNVIEAMLVEALRASAAKKNDKDHSAKQTGSHPDEGERDQGKDASSGNSTTSGGKEGQASTGKSTAEMELVQT